MIRLLIVDDSPLMRRLLGDLFRAEGDFEVAFARDGAEALAALPGFRPDVITLDIQMPGMDGLACLDRIMVEQPTPVVIASSLTVEGADEALAAIELGAVDVMAKPSGAISLRMEEFGPPLVERVRAAAQARLSRATRLRDRVRLRTTTRPPPRAAARPLPAIAPRAGVEAGLVLVGSSTGGPPALDALLAPLPDGFPWPIVIAQHMPASFTGALARRLDKLTPLAVAEVREPAELRPGCAYIARGDADILISRRGGVLTAVSAPSDPRLRWHPSVERLVASALDQLHPGLLVCVMLTGMGGDGAEAMARVFRGGGRTLAQSEASSVVWGMPGELVRLGAATSVCDLEDLAGALVDAVAA